MARRTMQVVATEFKRPIRDLLEDLYVRQGLTQAEIAAILRVNYSTVCRWMQILGVPARQPVWKLPDEEYAALR